MAILSANMPVNDDTVSRYSWSVHCATAAGRAKYAYCADPEPAVGGSTAPVAIPVTTVTTATPVNDDTVSRYSWSVHCATAAGRAKYAYCADPEPAAGVTIGQPVIGQPVIGLPIINEPIIGEPTNDDTVSRYSWEVHCATAAGKAKYAYCADPEPAAGAALMNLDMSNVKVMHLADWCKDNDSAKAKAICPKKVTGEYSWEINHC